MKIHRQLSPDTHCLHTTTLVETIQLEGPGHSFGQYGLKPGGVVAGGRKKEEGRSLKMLFSCCLPLNHTRFTQRSRRARNKAVEGM